MSSIFSKVPPVSDERLAALIRSMEDPNPSDVRDDIWLCLIELQQLRAAAQPPTAALNTLPPGGDERAAARSHTNECMKAAMDKLWEVHCLVTGPDLLKRPLTMTLDRIRELSIGYAPWPFPPTHPAPLSGAGHAELAPAADPVLPLGSAVGGPGTYPCAGELQVRGAWYPCEVLGPVQNEEASGYRIKREGIPREFAVLAYRVRFPHLSEEQQ